MFRQLIAILLLFAFGAQTFNGTVMVLDYYTNTTSYAKHCENKARPMMHCNGKCQLMKKLREEEKKEQQNPERKAEYKNKTVASRPSFITLDFCKTHLSKTFTSYQQPFIPTGTCTDIFHPPALV